MRFNDFVGRIGYLRELEDKYQLGYGVHASPIRNDASSKPNEPLRSMTSVTDKSLNDGTQASGSEALYEKVQELVSMDAEERGDRAWRWNESGRWKEREGTRKGT